jgi:hypothetical protein
MTQAAYKTHPLRALVTQLLAFQQQKDLASPLVASNEQVAFSRDRIFSIARLVSDLLESTPATLASTQALSNIQNGFQAPINELNAFISNQNMGHVTNAASQLEQNVLPYLWGFPQQNLKLKQPTIAAIQQSQSDVFQKTLLQIEEQRESLKQSFEKLEKNASDLSVRFSLMQENAAKERAEASAEIANLKKLYSESESVRSSTFDGKLSEFQATFTTSEKSLNEKSSEIVSELERRRDEAARIVQVVGNIGVTGNYQNIATKETGQANFWRWATLIIFAVAIGIAVATFIKFWDQPVTSESLWAIGVRLLYAIAITAPAWYTASESARHRTNADRARQTELELAALGPFIELMPEDKKVEIRAKLTEAYFGKSVEAHRADSILNPESLKNIIEIIKASRK